MQEVSDVAIPELTTLADVARDQSNRGLIAILNAYAHRPVIAEHERLLDNTEQLFPVRNRPKAKRYSVFSRSLSQDRNPLSN